VNNNFMRPGQHKNNNNRNRNRNNNNNNRRNTGGGGSPNNKVFDSNGPDVKLRGTTQTIAEKYMQMGRDAQSSGDSVAAESYYQHAEHYYRLWAASQPVGQSLVMPRKMGEDEYDEEGEQINNEEDSTAENGNAESPQQVEGAEPNEAGGDPNFSPPLAEGQQRINRNNNFNNNRDNNNRNNNNRSRWQNRRNDRYDNSGNQEGSVAATSGEGSAPMTEAVSAPTPAAQQEHSGQWEAPSFLQRPTPIVNEAPVSESVPAVEADAPTPRRVRAPRKPRVEADVAVTPSDESSSSAE
jgi:Domain of unknown function (DUF4167)